jgi:transcriptional regulator with XRE-family HTH domain
VSSDHIAVNLRLLCGYSRSITEVCRQAGLNRQQFTKYLSGASLPSLHSLRRICDFFGVEDHEILLEPAAFRELIRLRPPRLGAAVEPAPDSADRFLGGLAAGHDDAAARMLIGYYFLYLRDDRRAPMISRSLVRMTAAPRGLALKALDFIPGGTSTLPSCVKYAGSAFVADGRVHVMARECVIGKSIWFASYYLTDFTRRPYLSGLSLGVEPDPRGEIIAMRSVLEYLGTRIDIRRELRRCGQIPAASPEIDAIIRSATDNDLRIGEVVLTPRL